jgi:hypothetical protein
MEQTMIDSLLPETFDRFPLWQMDITELAGKNIETKGREEVNKLLQQGWVLLYIYTLKYKEEDEWIERPMAILGRPRTVRKQSRTKKTSIVRIPSE